MLACCSCTDELGLVDEHLHEVGIGREVGMDDLERDHASRSRRRRGRARDVDLGHAADGELRQQLVAAESPRAVAVDPTAADRRSLSRPCDCWQLLLRGARVDEHRERAQRGARRLAVEGAHDFGRHAWRDVEDELGSGVGDEVDAEARAVDLAIDLLRASAGTCRCSGARWPCRGGRSGRARSAAKPFSVAA